MVGMVTFERCWPRWTPARQLRSPLRGGGHGEGPGLRQADDTIDHMRSLMTELHVRYLPIMEEAPAGVLSFHGARAA